MNFWKKSKKICGESKKEVFRTSLIIIIIMGVIIVALLIALIFLIKRIKKISSNAIFNSSQEHKLLSDF
jgi:divalent metal cation (Fe/Co/Zn/Cd) transporter